MIYIISQQFHDIMDFLISLFVFKKSDGSKLVLLNEDLEWI